MGELTTIRWKKYGKDRLYVKDAAGTDLGWVDLVTGERHLSDAVEPCEADALLAPHGAAAPVVPSPEYAEAADSASAVLAGPDEPAAQDADRAQALPDASSPAAPEWYDLALNRPGQAARARAEDELAAMREKTRVGTWLARTLDVKTDERAWRVGADGEETIGAKLEKLTKDGWYVLHSVPVGKRGSDIDHVVIGPGGVFTVNTKKHPGKKVWVSKTSILVNGQQTDYLRNSRFEGERATKLLTAAAGFPVFVKPVLIFTTGTLIPDVTIKSKPDDVGILDRMDIPRAFKRSTVTLGPEQVDEVYAVARRSTTWVS